MVRQTTIDKVITFLTDVKNSGEKSILAYCRVNNISWPANWYSLVRKCQDIPEVKELLDSIKDTDKEDSTDSITESTEYVRDSEGRIVGYKFNIKRKVGGPLIGTFSRTQMDTLCSLYSRYGADITTAQTSLAFPEYSLDELNRIKRAFLIFKYSCPFAPHEVDEHTESELHNLAIERKKNNLTRTLEKNQLKDALKINMQLAEENQHYKDITNFLSDIHIDLTGMSAITPKEISSKQDLMLNLADLHIGAKVESDSLYNNPWDEKEIHTRLSSILEQVSNLGTYNIIYVNLLGDMLDGQDNMTARRDHIMPQCMDNKEQFNVFLKQVTWFISNLQRLSNKVIVHSVPNGNHTGAPEYYAVIALKYALEQLGIKMTVFDKFIGCYTIEDHLILMCHGKDARFMKRPLPLHLNPNAIVWLNNYMDRNGITNKYLPGKIHVIKGDLHTAGYDNTYKFDYRNCLSLFGDSDYSQMNYNSNPRGCSYSLIINNNFINGEFVC